MRSYCQCSPKPQPFSPEASVPFYATFFLLYHLLPTERGREHKAQEVGGTFPFPLTQAEMGADLKVTFLLYASSFILVHIAGQT